MIKNSIKIHDKFSVVIDVTYDKLFKKKKSKYTTLTYLFFPDSLNINHKTYPPAKFYNDVRLNIKYETPNYTLDDINIGGESLYQNLLKNTKKFIDNRSEKNHLVFKDQVKMFASIFCSLAREESRYLIKSKDVSKERINYLLEKITFVLSDFRKLVTKTKKINFKEEVINVIFYADEHMSNVVEFQLMKLYNHLKRNNYIVDELIHIVKLINKEQKYKKQEHYDSVKSKSIDPDKLLFKQSQLKKYIESVFFLNQEVRKDGAMFEQTMLAMAAGLAMVFSTGIAFYYQRVYGNFTMPFFIALVVSYMLKDRIKGLISLLFISRSRFLFNDYKIKIKNSLGEKIGIFRENFIFVPLKKLGPKVKKYRLTDMVVRMSENSLNENVIQYKKKIIIYPKKFGDDLPDKNINGLTDVTRLNFHRFIRYMDNPKKDFILIKKGEVYHKIANKIYHINIIQKFFTEEGVEFRRYRVILNRNGIRKIEKVALEDL